MDIHEILGSRRPGGIDTFAEYAIKNGYSAHDLMKLLLRAEWNEQHPPQDRAAGLPGDGTDPLLEAVENRKQGILREPQNEHEVLLARMEQAEIETRERAQKGSIKDPRVRTWAPM